MEADGQILYELREGFTGSTKVAANTTMGIAQSDKGMHL